jgi:hypothetical protein
MVGAVITLAGFLLIIFRKRFICLVARHQEAFWGFHYTARDIKMAEIVSIIVGVGFLAGGILNLLQLIRPK